jgi:hypothetical protein
MFKNIKHRPNTIFFYKNLIMNDSTGTTTFETLKFDNLSLRSLPIDQIKDNYVRQVKNACFSKVIS